MEKDKRNTEIDCASLSKKVPCPVAKILKVIGSKWTLLIIHNLTDGTKRFGEIMSELPGISPRTLSARLSALEKNQIITKQSFAVVPPRTEYTLTRKGKDLRRVFMELDNWDKKFDTGEK